MDRQRFGFCRGGRTVWMYTAHNKNRDDELEKMVREHGIAAVHELNGPLKPGSVAFLATRDGINHRDYVTRAWTQHPVRDILDKIAQRMATMAELTSALTAAEATVGDA